MLQLLTALRGTALRVGMHGRRRLARSALGLFVLVVPRSPYRSTALARLVRVDQRRLNLPLGVGSAKVSAAPADDAADGVACLGRRKHDGLSFLTRELAC